MTISQEDGLSEVAEFLDHPDNTTGLFPKEIYKGHQLPEECVEH